MTQRNGKQPDLEPILRPRSIAVIGAGRDPESMSGRLFRNLLASFAGPVYPINPYVTAIESIRAYASILDVPDPIDLAFVAVPAAHVVAVVRECLSRGVRGLVVITAGFSEIGPTGEALQDEILTLVRTKGVRMVGPNCLGVVNTAADSGLNGTFSGFPFPSGNIGVASQSGALGFVIPDLLRASQVGLSTLISMGNKADLNENDLIASWRDDPRTDVGLIYLESFADPRGFVEIARDVTARKPIVALIAGRTGAGTRAAGSHTAALATPAAVANAVLRQAGVIRVDELQELAEVTMLLATQPLPAGRRVAILTNAGGPGVLIADALEEQGLLVPPFSSTLQAQLRALVRAEATVRNPVDLVGSNDPELYSSCLRVLLESGEAETVVAMFVPIRPGDSSRIARALLDRRRQAPTSPTLLAVFVESQPPTAELTGAGVTIPTFAYPERAAKALGRVVAYDEARRRVPGRISQLDRIDAAAIRTIVEDRTDATQGRGGWLPPFQVQRLLTACDLPIPRWAVASSAEDAVAFGERLGGPFVMKIDSPTVLHKKAAGGILVNIQGAEAIRAAFARLTRAFPDSRGLFLQELLPEGIDALAGVMWETSAGHLIGCGLGGSWTEALGRVDFRLHPLTDRDAEDLIRDNPIGRLLETSGPSEAARWSPLQDVLLRLSALLSLAPEIVEADLNPIRILPDGSLRVLDARFRRAGDSTMSPCSS